MHLKKRTAAGCVAAVCISGKRRLATIGKPADPLRTDPASTDQSSFAAIDSISDTS